MMFAPVTMLGVGMELNVELDDFSEIEEHPMAEKLLLSFNEIFEKILGSSYEDAMDAELNTEGITTEPNSQEDFFLQSANLHQMLVECLKDSRVVSKVQVNASIPSALMNVELDIEAPGVKTAFLSLLKLSIPPL